MTPAVGPGLMRPMHDQEFRQLGAVVCRALGEARLESTWAAQVLARASAALLPAQGEDAHTWLAWQSERESLVTADLSGKCVALRVRDATLQVVAEDIFVEAEFMLSGRTLDEALAWARSALSATQAFPALAQEPEAHELGRGGHFSLGLDAPLLELASWYDDAQVVLSALAARRGGSPVRCTPHDLALFTDIAGAGAPQRVGMSPGDSSLPEPHFFVRGAAASQPPLPHGGRWHADSWTGALLPGSAVTSVRDAAGQQQRIAEFLEAALGI